MENKQINLAVCQRMIDRINEEDEQDEEDLFLLLFCGKTLFFLNYQSLLQCELFAHKFSYIVMCSMHT